MINAIEDEQTRDFAEACYDDMSLAQLEGLTLEDVDLVDCRNWRITAEEWLTAVQAAYAEKRSAAEETSPFEQKYDRSDWFRVISDDVYPIGTLVKLAEDDGSIRPLFKVVIIMAPDPESIAETEEFMYLPGEAGPDGYGDEELELA